MNQAAQSLHSLQACIHNRLLSDSAIAETLWQYQQAAWNYQDLTNAAALSTAPVTDDQLAQAAYDAQQAQAALNEAISRFQSHQSSICVTLAHLSGNPHAARAKQPLPKRPGWPAIACQIARIIKPLRKVF